MASTKKSASSQASSANTADAYANFAAGRGPYPNQNVYYNPQSDPTGGYGALSNFDFSKYAGNRGAIQELGRAYGINLSPEQLNVYARNPQSLGSLRAGGTPGWSQGSNQGYGYSGAGGQMATSGGIPLGTLMMQGSQQPQGAPTTAPPPAAPTGATVMHPLQLPGAMTQAQVAQQVGTQPVYVGANPGPLQFPQVSTPPTLRVGQAMPGLPAGADLTGAMTQAQVAQQVGTQPVYVGANPGPLQFPQVSTPPTLQVGQAMPQPPVQQYGAGGLVQRFQTGGQVQQIQPGVTRNAQGGIDYTDPRLQSQLGLGDLTTAQQTALGLDPAHAQALSGATQVAAQYQPYFLGAAALNMPAVINLPPSGTPSSRSGVAATPGAIVGNAVPQTPQGPWLTNPSVFARATPNQPTAAPTITPQTPATAVPYTAGQAFATPPAAPGYTLGATMPQTSVPAAQTPWLASAGGGGGGQGAGYVPQAWQRPPAGAPLPYSGTVHNDPYMSHAVSSLLGMPSNPWHPGTSPGATAGAKQMATGGIVPGRGNEDTVPALLTPGEYVIPKEQVNQLMRTGSTAIKMQSGGLVQDPDPDPPEARRQPLQVPAPTSSQSSTPSAPSQHPGAAQSILGGLQNLYQGRGGMSGGLDLRNTPADPDPDLPYLKAAGMGGGGGLGSAGAQSALGGVASGLNQAAQAIASSVQPWQMQQSAIPDPSQLPKYQTPTLQPVRVT